MQKLIACVPLCEMKHTSPGSPACRFAELSMPIDGLDIAMQLGPTSAMSEREATLFSSASSSTPIGSPVSEKPAVKND